MSTPSLHKMTQRAYTDSSLHEGLQGACTVLTVGEVAKRLGLPAHTIRRWAEYHRQHLGEAANPETPGAARRFTEMDVQVLHAAQQLRAQGLTVAVINQRLGGIAIGEVEQGAIAPQSAQDEPGGGLMPIMVLEAIESVQRRVEILEQQRTRIDVAFLVVSAFVAGLLVGLAVWWFQ